MEKIYILRSICSAFDEIFLHRSISEESSHCFLIFNLTLSETLSA